MILTLYVNDPLGKRCRINVEAAQKVQEEYPIEIRIVKHRDKERTPSLLILESDFIGGPR
ncbi:MAG: hypothetical protein ABSG42_04105 [Nitrospirota bacterium]